MVGNQLVLGGQGIEKKLLRRKDLEEVSLHIYKTYTLLQHFVD